MDRKEFIRISGRWIILSLLTVFTAGVILKRRVSPGNSCDLTGQCRGCSSLSSCNLPEAIKLRKDEEEKGI
jgi:hypothetical protein